jgi:predicted ATPase
MNHFEHLYGRKRETECLENILSSFLNKIEVAVSSEAETWVAVDEKKRKIVTTSGSPNFQSYPRFNCQFVLVRGSAGSGKRAFVRSILKRTLERQSIGLPLNDCPFLFVSGRFRSSQRQNDDDEYAKRTSVVDDRPFSAFDETIREIMKILLESGTMMSSVHQRLQQLLKGPDEFEILTKTFPSMKRWFQSVSGSQNVESARHAKGALDLPELSFSTKTPVLRPVLLGSHLVAQQSQVQCPVLVRFFEAVASCIPLVFLLEDLEYADEASFILVEELMKSGENWAAQDVKSKGFLIIATSRIENEMSASGRFSSILHRCRDSVLLSDSLSMLSNSTSLSHSGNEVKDISTTDPELTVNLCFHQILLSNLTWDDVFEWVKACDGVIERCTLHQKREITDLALHHSDGNPLRIRYCLLFLGYDESILQGAINKEPVPNRISDLYSAILSRQNTEIQNIVRTAAALAQSGEGDIDRDILEIALEMEVPCIDSLNVAHELGLLEFVPVRDCVRFSCVELQNIAYSAIPFATRAFFHLDIGRRIWKNALEGHGEKETDDNENIGKVFLATLQLRNSVHLLVDFEERFFMSQLCYEAGHKSSLLGDFPTASKLLEFAICLLGSALWRSELYETSLVLHNALAQAYCCVGDFKNMEVTLDSIFDNAICFRDKLSAYIILVYATGTRLKILEAFRIASFALRELGEPVNQNPSIMTVVVHLLRTKSLLRGKSDVFFRNLGVSEDADYLVISQLLSFAMIHSYVVCPEASFLLCFRLIRLSIKHGLSGPSVVAFVAYGFLLCASGSFEEGYRYGRLALELVDKFEVWRPRVQMFMFGYISHWAKPFRDCLEPLQLSQYCAFMYGDLEVYAGCTSFYILVLLNSGSSLRNLEPSARSFCCSMELFGQKNALLFSLPIWEFISELSSCNEPLNLSGEIKDAATALKFSVKEGNKFVSGSFYMLRTMWCYLISNYSEAIQMARKTAEYRHVSDYALTFYEALASLAMAWASKGFTRKKFIHRGRTLSKRIKCWAQLCSSNFHNKQLLLEAETAALNGNSTKALDLFQLSIHEAGQEGFIHEEAIAYERLGHYQLFTGRNASAIMSFEKARDAYQTWGAIVLVEKLNKIISQL